MRHRKCVVPRNVFVACIFRQFVALIALATVAFAAQAQQVLGIVDLDGLGKSALVVRNTTTTPTIKAGRYAGNTFTFTDLADPGINFRLLGAARLDAGAKSDLLMQNISTGDFGEARTWLDFDSSKNRLLRNVKRVWDVQAVGDLDGDGFGDLVWRYMADDPRDTGVSFVWFTNGAANTDATVQNPSNVVQVRKRGGAPLSWRLLGTRHQRRRCRRHGPPSSRTLTQESSAGSSRAARSSWSTAQSRR